MKKILFLIPSLDMGGMERVLVNYANLYVKYGYDVTVINFTHTDPDLKEQIDKNVHYYDMYVPVPHILHASVWDILKGNFRILPWIKWIQFHSAQYLYKKYIHEFYDVEVGFCGSPAIKIIGGSSNQKSQKIGWIHGDNIYNDVPQAGGFRKAKKIYTEIDKIVCVSDVAVADIKKVFNRTSKIYKVLNPNDVDKIRESAKKTVDRSERITFVCVGRVVNEQKGFDRVLSAVSKLNKEGYLFDVWIVGDGFDLPKLEAQKRENQLNNVVLWGKQSNPYKYMNAADVFICSSCFEAYGMVVSEALILAKPVISTNTEGPAEILQGGKYGMLVDNSTDGIYGGMKRVLDDKKLIEELKTKAISGKDRFDPELTLEELERVFND